MKHGWLKITGLSLALTFCLGLLVLPARTQAQNNGKTSNQPVTRDKISDDYSKALELIRANYVEAREADDLTNSSIRGMLKVLDPHSDYLDLKAFRDFNEKQNSRYFGIGALISSRLRSTYIMEPFNHSPAVRAGLRYGDQIVNIDGKDTSNWESGKVRELLLGDRGTQVRVTVKRPGSVEPLSFIITRDQIAYPSIPNYYIVKPGIGYIGLTRNFQITTTMELVTAIAELREKGATQFILDLRGNGGGYLDQGIRVSDKLLQKGQPIVSVRYRTRPDDRYVAESGASDNFPLVVLINDSTASASEIVSGAVQDHDRGLIVGQTSFGKGLVQRVFPMMSGGGLILTTGHYYTPSGRLIQRDYSNGSLVEYYTRRNANGVTDTSKKGEMKTTDLGRQVYGGGGIEPDIKLDPPPTPTLAQLRLSLGTFYFVRELINGQVAGASQFKLSGMDYESKLKGTEYLVSDEVLKAWADFSTKFAKEHPEVGVRLNEIEENKVWARLYIREEVLKAAYGEDRSKQVLADLDLQLQRGIQELPNAAALYERARGRHNAMNRR